VELKLPDKNNFLNPREWLRGIVRATLRARPVRRIWEWIDDGNVSIPIGIGSPNPGPLKTDRLPIYRGLYDLFQQARVHFFTFVSSVRTGKTLLSICCVLWWIAERCGGPVLWLDPTRKSAIKFSRTELDPFIRECPGAWGKAIVSKTTWTALEKFFRGCFLRLIGSGAEADLHGFQAEFVVLNESVRLRASIDKDATSADKAIARSAQFEHTRKILRNSTPEDEFDDIWTNFLLGSQHYAYLPCPHCSKPKKNFVPPSPNECEIGRSPLSYDPGLAGWQRFTMWSEEKEVPFAEDGALLPIGETRTEKTGEIHFEQFAIYKDRETEPGKIEKVKAGYDMPALEQGATYQCAHCAKQIERVDLGWMLARYWLRGHNPKPPHDHVSAHLWAAYSPFQSWGAIAKEFLLAKGNPARMRKFYNLTLGLPFKRYAASVKEDDLDRAAKRCPRPYAKGTLPLKPELLTMCVDVGGMHSGNFWWSIRAWGILWDHPELPTWNALIDWGPAVSWAQIEEFAGLVPLPAGKRDDESERFNEYTWRDPQSGEASRFRVTAGLIDSGFEAKEEKNVYEFCVRWDEVFSPSKGGGQNHLRGNVIRTSPVHDAKLELVWYWDDWFKSALYYHAIKEGKKLWFLPTNIDEDYRVHLTIEHTVERNGKLVWEGDGAHLADTEKEHEVLRDTIEDKLDEIREAHRAAEEKKEEAENETGR
jgi:Phage terminase large subunit (GpA)